MDIRTSINPRTACRNINETHVNIISYFFLEKLSPTKYPPAWAIIKKSKVVTMIALHGDWNRGRVITTVVVVPCNVICGFGIGEAIHGDCGIGVALSPPWWWCRAM